MKKIERGFSGMLRNVRHDSRGVTGLETAIVLIAFVVVSTVFAFAALSTGLFSADKSKDTIEAGLAESRSTVEVKGAVQLNVTIGTHTSLTTVASDDYETGQFPVLVGSETITSGGSSLSIGADYTLVYDTGRITLIAATSTAPTITYQAYTADSIVLSLGNAAGGAAVDLTPGETVISYQDDNTESTGIVNFGVTRLGNANRDNLLEQGETFNVTVDTSTFGLTDEEIFTVQIKPPTGAVILVSRAMPVKIETVMFLE